MATQLSAVTMIGTTGQGATRRNALHPVLLRAADRDGDPRRDARAVPARRARCTPRTSISSAASTRRRDRSPRSCFCSRAACRAARSSPRRPSCSRRSSAGPSGWSVALIGVPDGALHDDRRRAGGDVGRRQADGAHRRRAARGRRSCCSCSIPVSPDDALHDRRRGGTPAGVRLLVQPHEDVHVLVGHHRRHVPDAVVLRHGPEPGAALSHRAARWTKRAARC